MNKRTKIVIIIGIILFIIMFGLNNTNILGKKATKLPSTEGITVIPTMRDKITSDSSWCGTFQLVWNDMKNDVVKKDIVFTPQEKMADNLNKEEFTQDMISDEYYFKIYGLKSIELKEKIEKGIREKFNQSSNILNDFNWSENELNDTNNTDVKRYFFYAMLYRKFEFLQEFDKLEDAKFGNKYNNIQYFGIDKNTKDSIGDQIEVLYYNSKDDFAIGVNTRTGDNVIFCKNPQGKNFKQIYENMNNKAKKYKGSITFEDVDEFKAPNLTFNIKKEYTELQNKEFKINDPIYDKAEIIKSIQTIEFSLNEKGGEIKSEAATDMWTYMGAAASESKPDKPRYFYVDDTFAIFLKEKGKSMPYFAGRVEDITKFQ